MIRTGLIFLAFLTIGLVGLIVSDVLSPSDGRRSYVERCIRAGHRVDVCEAVWSILREQRDR